MRRKIDPEKGRAALAECVNSNFAAPRAVLLTATRFTLEEIACRAPGGSVEIRIPPAGAVQAIAGSQHRRGTPPATVQTDMLTWLRLCTGQLAWATARAEGALVFSGLGSDLSPLLPLFPSELA